MPSSMTFYGAREILRAGVVPTILSFVILHSVRNERSEGAA